MRHWVRFFVIIASVAILLAAVSTSRPATSPTQQRIASVSPADGAILTAGDTVHFTITPIAGVEFDSVELLCNFCPPAPAVGNPLTIDVPLPETLIGNVTILFRPVVGGTSGLAEAFSYRVVLPATVALQELVVLPPTFALRLGESEVVAVFGLYSDGILRPLTSTSGVNLAVDQPAVAVLEVAQGGPNAQSALLTAVGFGTTYLRIDLDGISATAVVRVPGADIIGDLNDDGRVDKEDESPLRSGFGEAANPEDPRDLNRDGVIDKRDLDVLKGLSVN